MAKKWEYYVSTVIADENDRVKTAEKLEAMMKNRSSRLGISKRCTLWLKFSLCYLQAAVGLIQGYN